MRTTSQFLLGVLKNNNTLVRYLTSLNGNFIASNITPAALGLTAHPLDKECRFLFLLVSAKRLK